MRSSCSCVRLERSGKHEANELAEISLGDGSSEGGSAYEKDALQLDETGEETEGCARLNGMRSAGMIF